MDISGSYTFDAPPTRVWDLLMDPNAIASCIPGCQHFEADGEDRYRARLHIALAAVTGTYEGLVILSDKVPPTSYRLTGEGKGHAGFIKGTADIALHDGAANHRAHPDDGRDCERDHSPVYRSQCL